MLKLWRAALCFSGLVSSFATAGEVQFRADYYERDIHTNSLRGRGHAWVKSGNRELWADEMSLDSSTNTVIATGNVRVKQNDFEMWGTHVTYLLNGDEATIDNAVIVSKQLVLKGSRIIKLSPDHFKIEEGVYTNCNVDMLHDKGVGECNFDWKVYGRRFDITMEGYVHIEDAIVFAKGLPVFYSPYFILPVKSKRQSGLLLPSLGYAEHLGSGITLPVFLALGPWHDLLITPTQYSETGYHVGLNYRYYYDAGTRGEANIFFTQRRFSLFPNPAPENVGRSRAMGFIGEWAVDLKNVYPLGGRAHSRQSLLKVSDPYYTYDYSDLGGAGNSAALRSQLSVTAPGDEWFAAAKISGYQSLTISKDVGVDRGAPTQLPSLLFSRSSTPALGKYLSYEIDTQFTNYYRRQPFDQVPGTPSDTGVNTDTDTSFDGNDYLRTGQRLHVEPRLIAHVPMPTGFQFQPVFKAGSLLYRFPMGASDYAHREYLEAELPVSMHLSRRFDTGISDFERISHILQPRFIYAVSPYQNAESPHEFFFRKGPLSNPRFDVLDQVTPFEYMRFELINRFLRKVGPGAQRFFTLQVSEQYNLRTSAVDPRFQRRLGPIEILAEWKSRLVSAQVQANYFLERTSTGKLESDWSSAIEYADEGGNRARFNTLFVERSDPKLIQRTLYLQLYKVLPFFFDVGGEMEYSLKTRRFGGYTLGFYFRSKPLSCWRLGFEAGRSSNEQPFARINFGLSFGAPSDFKPL